MKNDQLTQLEQSNRALRSHLKYLKNYESNLNIQIGEVTSARAYIYWQKFNNLKKASYYISKTKQLMPYEWRYGLKKILSKFKSSIDKHQLEQYKLSFDKKVPSEDKINPIQETVSVIIPTKNAGLMLDTVFKSILSQKHLFNIEIIIVDSGSTDRTLSIAKKYGVKIIAIHPNEFSHSKSRNIGAQAATGEYLIFTVQDAIMLNENTIFDSISFLRNSKAVACSARQIPRSDADVFTAWQISNFTKMISPGGKDQVVDIDRKAFSKLDSVAKRACCTIDDVFAIYKKKEFINLNGYDESLRYGEDLEIGKRIIENGNRIAYLYSNGVIHSHNRSASYFLKRYYVDTVFLHKVFKDTAKDDGIHENNIHQLIQSLIIIGTQLEKKCTNLKQFKILLGEKLGSDFKLSKTNNKLNSIDTLKELLKYIGPVKNSKINHYEQMSREFNFFLENILQELCTKWSLLTLEHSSIVILIDKVYSIFVSSQLAKYHIIKNSSDEHNVKVHTFLQESI